MAQIHEGSLSELHFDDANANNHTARGLDALENSLQRLGLGRSIVVDKDNRIIAGNATAMKAGESGVAQRVVFVETDGNTLVAVRRTDLSIDDAKARELAIADNRVGELNLDWNDEVIDSLIGQGVEVSNYFSQSELDILLATVDANGVEYEPTLDPQQGSRNTVTDDDVQETSDRLSSQFGERSAQDITDVQCPHCGQSFGIDKTSL